MPTIMLTIDVEDWFQVENFKPWIPFSTWDQHELRVERNVHRILDLYDSQSNYNSPTALWSPCLKHLTMSIQPPATKQPDELK